ncbi:hypothetical protein [Burkholderia ubonensis]|uniref:Nmad3 family putative nucleotide modification protein n=1 Tax=Burkholderia ubonensis TaxID=101571 RepID=UPI000B4DF668|nr:hypothetical protein [Burkholderia ubonensis]
MKVVFSRKGFDSQYGGMPSPILPDGRLLPLPIPSSHDSATLADLDFSDAALDRILCDLSAGKHGWPRNGLFFPVRPRIIYHFYHLLSGWRIALMSSGNRKVSGKERSPSPYHNKVGGVEIYGNTGMPRQAKLRVHGYRLQRR